MPVDCNKVGSSLKSGVPFILQKLYGSHRTLPKGTNWDANQNRMIMTNTPWVCPDMTENPASSSMYSSSYVRTTMAFVEMENQKLDILKYPKYGGFPRYYVEKCRKPARLLLFVDHNSLLSHILGRLMMITFPDKQHFVQFLLLNLEEPSQYKNKKW